MLTSLQSTDAVPAPRHAVRGVERALFGFGVVCLLAWAGLTLRAMLYQREAGAEIERMIAARHAPGASVPDSTLNAPILTGHPIGLVSVPRLNLFAVIAEGDDDSTLGKAVGHLPDTPMPWQQGNAALAAHRDTLFRPLKDIRIGDVVLVTTARGEFSYRVTKTRIVNPEDVWVLAPTPDPSLTLITCYPFYFIGHAPKRFIVHAERMG